MLTAFDRSFESTGLIALFYRKTRAYNVGTEKHHQTVFSLYWMNNRTKNRQFQPQNGRNCQNNKHLLLLLDL